MRRMLAILPLVLLTGCVHAQIVQQLGGTGGAGGTAGFQSNVQPQLALNTALCKNGTCASGTLNQPYTLSIPILHGIPTYTCSLSSGTLPNGTTLTTDNTNNLCVVSGTLAPNAGAFTFNIKVVDSASTPNQALSGNLTVNVGCPKFSPDPLLSLPPAQQGTAYSHTFQPQGGITPYSCSITNTLPPGETLTGCVLAGTPSVAGSYSFTITQQDSCNTGAQSVSATYTEQVNTNLAVTTTSLPGGTVGQSYGQTLSVAGGTGPYNWTLASGNLPTGISLSSGVLSGTPTTPGTSNFTVKVTDSLSNSATQILSITISCTALAITNPSTLCSGTQTQPYSCQMTASGGFGALTWSGPGLSACGLSIGASTGLISGTASCLGTFSPTISATDSCPTPQTASGVFDITIKQNIGTLAITTASPLQTPTTGLAFSQQMTASGGVPPYNWTLTAGAFPAGINMSASGLISGTATQAVSVNPTIQVTDSQPVSTSATFSMTSVCPALNISTASLPPGRQGTAYSAQINANGGYLTLSYSATGLPTGLSINSSTGAISGTPSTSGTFAVAVSVTDSCSPTAQVTTQNYSLVINTNLAITTGTLPNGTVSTPYSATISAAGGTQPYAFTITAGTQPTSLSLSSAGVLSGTPSVAGTYNFTVTVTDNLSNTATQAYTVTIAPAAPPPPGTVSLPQNWVNTHECDTALSAPNQTINFPSSWAGGGAYPNTQAGLNSALADAEAYRNAHQSAGAIRLNVTAGTTFSGATTIVLPQATGDASTKCIAIVTTGTLIAGQTVCTHGIQDNVSESTDIGTRNPTCAVAFNDVAQMFTLETTAANVPALKTGPADANGVGPHHYLIIGMEARELAGSANTITYLAAIGSNQLNETSVGQLASHIYIDRSWFHGDWTDGGAGANNISHMLLMDCFICGVTNSQWSMSENGGAQNQAIFSLQSQTMKVVHNWFDGPGQNMICGGSAMSLTTGIQSCNDLEFRRNRLSYPAAWLGSTFKPHGQSPERIAPFELKSCNRCLVDGNIMENVDDTGAQYRPIGLNPKAYNNVRPQYYIGVSNVTVTHNIFRHICDQGGWFNTRSLVAPNGNGVSMPLTLVDFEQNLAYDISKPSFCSTSNNAGTGIEWAVGYTPLTACTATRDSAGRTATITNCATGTGLAQSDISVGDLVTVSGCADTSFNVSAQKLGTPALQGTNPNAVLVVYTNNVGISGANATTTGCIIANFQGYPKSSTFVHNTIISASNSVGGFYSALQGGTAGGFPFMQLNQVHDNLLTAGGISGQGLSDSSNPTAEASLFDLSTSTVFSNIYAGRNCAGYVDVSQTGGVQIKPPNSSYCPITAFCTTTDPTAGSCVGIAGAMSQSSLNVNASDWNVYGLCHNGTAGCSKASLYSAGNTRQASDSTDRGASMPAINTAQTLTLYVCATSCGGGPFALHAPVTPRSKFKRFTDRLHITKPKATLVPVTGHRGPYQD